jgi:hypothetical protein
LLLRPSTHYYDGHAGVDATRINVANRLGKVAGLLAVIMDIKDLSAVLLKTVGLVMLAYAVFEIPLYFPPHVNLTDQYSILDALVEATGTLILPIVLGLVLWFFPATVTNKIVSGEKLSGERFGAPQLERVALTVVGSWLVAYGIADLIYSVATMIVLQRQYAGLTIPPSRYIPGIITSVAKVGLGVGLAFGAKGIARLVDRVRGGD